MTDLYSRRDHVAHLVFCSPNSVMESSPFAAYPKFYPFAHPQLQICWFRCKLTFVCFCAVASSPQTTRSRSRVVTTDMSIAATVLFWRYGVSSRHFDAGKNLTFYRIERGAACMQAWTPGVYGNLTIPVIRRMYFWRKVCQNVCRARGVDQHNVFVHNFALLASRPSVTAWWHSKAYNFFSDWRVEHLASWAFAAWRDSRKKKAKILPSASLLIIFSSSINISSRGRIIRGGKSGRERKKKNINKLYHSTKKKACTNKKYAFLFIKYKSTTTHYWWVQHVFPRKR